MNAQVEVEETETEETPTGGDQNKKPTVFTQEQVNAVVAKEKASWKRSLEKDKGSWSETETSLKEQIAARDEVIQKSVDILKKDLQLDELTAELLTEKDALAQYNFLLKMVEKNGKQDIPRTPRGEEVVNRQPFKRRTTI